MWERFERGRALYTLNPDAAERAALTDRLRDTVRAKGISGLANDGDVMRDFILFASLHLAEHADRLAWRPVLRPLGIDDEDIAHYTELYPRIEATLARAGRPLIVGQRGRRFLGTFLREGGLPVAIGNLPDLVVRAAELFGWSALRNVEARALAIEHVRKQAAGAARTLFDTEEGQAALDDLLCTAAEARSLLVERGVDPTTLTSPEEVRKALASAEIPLPAVRNEGLLAAVLTSFTRDVSAVSPLPAVRLVAIIRDGAAEVAIHVDLEALDAADLPAGVTHVVLSAEPCTGGRRPETLERRDDGRFVVARTGERSLEWRRTLAPAPSTVHAKFVGRGGIAETRTVSTVGWPAQSELWFDAAGELLAEIRDSLQPGERFTIVALTEVDIIGAGGVSVSPLGTPALAKGAWRVDVEDEGELQITSGEGVRLVLASARPLVVTVLAAPTVELVPQRFVRSLPDLVLPDGVTATVEVARPTDARSLTTIGSVRGFARLSSHPALARLHGTLRVSLRTDDGRSWRARWTVLPRFSVRPRIGAVEIVGLREEIEFVTDGHVTARTDGVKVVHADEGAASVTIHLRLGHGELVSFPMDVPSSRLRLWSDSTLSALVPMANEPTVTERMIHSGACIEHAGLAGSELFIRSPAGDLVLREIKRGTQRSFVRLSELYLHQIREGKATEHYVAAVSDAPDDAIRLRVHLPRLARPRTQNDGAGVVRLTYDLDPGDLPAQPALAYFPITPPLGQCVFRDVAAEHVDGRVSIRVDDSGAPGVAGMYVAFLVDRSADPPRAMSFGCKLNVPVSLGDLPPPSGQPPLERAIWLRNRRDVAQALRDLVGSAFGEFARALVAAAFEREPFGLRAFLFFSDIAELAQWVIVACAAHLGVADQDRWLSLWGRELPGFSWLRLTRSDVELLARALPAQSSEDRMALLVKARGATRMLRCTEHLLERGLFRGPSRFFVDAARSNVLNAAAGLDIVEKPKAFSLPASGPAVSWLRGAGVDDDVLATIEAELGEKIMRGARARAIRDLFMHRELPPSDAEISPGSFDAWTVALLRAVDDEWRAIPSSEIVRAVRKLDRDCAAAAVAVVDHQNGRSPRSNVFRQIVMLERRVPDLLDAWVVAVSLRRSAEGAIE